MSVRASASVTNPPGASCVPSVQSNALANKVSKEKQEDLKTFCSEFLALADVDTVRVTSIDRYAHPPLPRRPRRQTLTRPYRASGWV